MNKVFIKTNRISFIVTSLVFRNRFFKSVHKMSSWCRITSTWVSLLLLLGLAFWVILPGFMFCLMIFQFYGFSLDSSDCHMFVSPGFIFFMSLLGFCSSSLNCLLLNLLMLLVFLLFSVCHVLKLDSGTKFVIDLWPLSLCSLLFSEPQAGEVWYYRWKGEFDLLKVLIQENFHTNTE